MLPSNPMTISDSRLKANTWTGETIRKRYKGRVVDIADVQRDLQELKYWDEFERRTSASREEAKHALLDLLRVAKHRSENEVG